MSRPLEGIRVLELASYIAGPHCGMVLADLGAEVIKIEPPGGDVSHQAPPGKFRGETPYFYQVNRNKKSIILDLKQSADIEIFRDLVRKSDVVLTAFTQRAKEGLGLEFDSLRSLNPRIVFCTVTGFGDTGPYSDRPGYDFLTQCLSGMAHLHGDDGDGLPRVCRLSITDLMTGVYGAMGILSALRLREITGEAQKVDMGILDAALSFLSYSAANYLAFGNSPSRPSNSAHAFWVPCQIFSTSDSYLYLAVLPKQHWRSLCKVLAMPDWADELEAPDIRLQHKEKVIARIGQILLTRSTADWVNLLVAQGVPCAPVNDLDGALADPQIQARNMIVNVDHPLSGLVQIIGNPIKISGHVQEYRPSPLPNEHWDEIMQKVLEYDADRLIARAALPGSDGHGQ